MSFDDFPYNDSDANSTQNYDAIYKNIKEAINNSKLVFLDNQDLEDSIGYFIDENEPDKALEIIDYGLTIFPHNVEFLLLKAETLIDLQEFDKAFAMLKFIENKEPYNTRVYILRASIYELQNKEENVFDEYQSALLKNIDEPDLIYEELGFYFSTKLNYSEAAKNFIKCIEINKDNIEVFEALTDIYIERLGAIEGLAFFEQFTNSHDDCFNAWYSVGRLFQSEKLYHKAIKAYEKVLQNDKYHFIAIENVIQCLKSTENYERIIKICKYYSKFMYPYFIYEMAETYFDLENAEESLKYYFQLYDENQNDIDAILGIAKCFAFQGYFQKAFQFLEIGINNNKEKSELLVFKGLLFKETGDTDNAIETLEKALTLQFEDDNCDVYFELSDIYFESNDFQSAIDILVEGIEKNANNHRLMFFLAACYYKNNDGEKAYFCFEDAMLLDNNFYNIFFEKCPLAQNDNLFIDLINKHNKAD